MGSKKSNTEDVGAPAPAESKALEQWAEELGHLPQFREGGRVAVVGNPSYWKYAATKAFKGWKDGQQMTRAEYEAGIAENDALRFG